MKNIQEVLVNGILWVNVAKQGEKELAEVGKRFSLHEQDVKESLPPFHRPKFVKRADYYFMVLHFPVFDRETKRLGFTEVDFFLSSNHLITVHDSQLPVLENFFQECKKIGTDLPPFFQGTAVHVMFELLARLLDAIFPILLHINDDVDVVDKRLFAQIPGRKMAEEILRLKTNAVTFRRTMQGHRTVLERLIMYSGRDLDVTSAQNYVNSLREFTNEIWHMLESQKETINALHETNESLVGLRTNEVMKTLTIISVITFPLTLFVTLTDVNTVDNPFKFISGGFLIVLSAVLLGAAGMLWVFKKKKWM